MKLYPLPGEHETMTKKWQSDLARATKVVFISPRIHLRTLSFWHRHTNPQLLRSFTVIYDITGLKDSAAHGLDGKPELFKKFHNVEWRLFPQLNANFYYMEFADGDYVLYFGSAQLTDRGVGRGLSKTAKRQFAVLARLDESQKSADVVPMLEHLLQHSVRNTPVYDRNQWKKGASRPEPTETFGDTEYARVMERLSWGSVYSPVYGEAFSGLYVSDNHQYLKVHLTARAAQPQFTFSYRELEWLLGGFRKKETVNAKRSLLLVIAEDGDWAGALTVIRVKASQLFRLLAPSNRTRKWVPAGESLTIQVVRKGEHLSLRRYSRFHEIARGQLDSLPALVTV